MMIKRIILEWVLPMLGLVSVMFLLYVYAVVFTALQT